MVGKFFEYPFDTVKVRLQSQSERSLLRYSGPMDCFRQSVKADGILSLYRGISAPLFGAALETSSLFFSYRLTQDILRATVRAKDSETRLSLGALVFCGAVSGAFTSLVLTPVELVKCQMQRPRENPRGIRQGPLSVIASVYKHGGLQGFWHGQLGTFIRETGGSAAWFGSYEGASNIFRRHRLHDVTVPSTLPLWQQLLAGASAGMCYNFVCYPADTIKSRMQTEEITTDRRIEGTRRTFLIVGKELWSQQGLKGMYRGCGITVARAAPSSALIFAIYEGLKEYAHSARD